MAHKLAYYVQEVLLWEHTPELIEVLLLMVLQDPSGYNAPEFFDRLPRPEVGWDLDRWWEQVVWQRREQVKRELAEVYGESCESCESAVGTDMHEIIPRSSDTSWRQLELFSKGNCCLLCRKCHESGAASTEEFRERIRARRAWQGTSGSGVAS